MELILLFYRFFRWLFVNLKSILILFFLQVTSGFLFIFGLVLMGFPPFRHWFREQPGYVNHLSNWPLLRLAGPQNFLAGLLLYLPLFGPLGFLFLIYLVRSALAEPERWWLMLFFGPLSLGFGLLVLSGWFLTPFTMTEETAQRQRRRGGKRPSLSQLNANRNTVTTHLGFDADTVVNQSQRKQARRYYQERRLEEANDYDSLHGHFITFRSGFFFAVYLLSGWLVGLVGAVFCWHRPYYAHWLAQPGFIHRLSFLPFLKRPSPLGLAVTHLLLTLPSWIAFWWLYPYWTWQGVLAAVVVAPLAAYRLYGWYGQNWQRAFISRSIILAMLPQHRRWQKMHQTAVAAAADDRETAVSLFQSAIESAAQIHPRHYTAATSHHQLGLILMEMGRYEEASHHLHQAVDIRESAFGALYPQSANTQKGLARLFSQMGKGTEALLWYEKAVRFAQLKREAPQEYGLLLNEMGALYLQLNQIELANQYLHEALQQIEPYKKQSQWVATAVYLNLMALNLQLGLIDEVAHFEKLASASADDEQHLTLMTHQAAKLAQNGAFEAAIAKQKEVLGQMERPSPSLKNAKLTYQLATYLHEAERLEEAQTQYEKGITLFRRSPQTITIDYVNCVFDFGLLKATNGEFSAALRLFQEAFALEDKIVAEVLAASSENGRLAYLRSTQTRLTIFLALIRQHFREDTAVLATTNLLLQRHGLVAEVMGHTTRSGDELPPHVQQRHQQLNSLKMAYANKGTVGPQKEQSRSVFARQMRELQAQIEREESWLSRHVSYDSLFEELAELQWPAVAQSLQKYDLLLHFFYGRRYDFTTATRYAAPAWQKEGVMAFVVGANTAVACIDLGDAATIDDEVHQLREVIGQQGEYLSLSQRLCQRLLKPMTPYLKSKRSLLIVPDGALTTLPFELLAAPDGRHLIERLTISYLSSGRELLRSTQPTLSEDLIVMADPDYKTAAENGTAVADPARSFTAVQLMARGRAFGRLLGARKEGEILGRLLSVTPIMGQQATETAVKNIAAPKLLHLATHGFFLPQEKGHASPSTDRMQHLKQQSHPLLRCGLVMAGANRWLDNQSLQHEGEDGILNGLEVAQLNLRGTELVVLSACDTALGEVEAGEGVFGLRRAITMAGARTLVMSLWQVPDRATQQLMVQFYKRMLAGEPRVEALRQAQLTMLAHRPHPFFWGAFISQGAREPLFDSLT